MEISGALNQYVNICRDTFNGYYRKIKQKYEICCGHTKKNKINFTQLARYGNRCEQCYRQTFFE